MSILFLLNSCNNDAATAETIVVESFDFFENRTIIVETGDDMQFPTIQNGENLVFEYGVFTKSSDELVVDDETSTRLIFEIGPMLDSFEFTNQELENINCYFFTSNSEFSIMEKVNRGAISGTQISNASWNILINVVLDTRMVEVGGVFNLRGQN